MIVEKSRQCHNPPLASPLHAAKENRHWSAQEEVAAASLDAADRLALAVCALPTAPRVPLADLLRRRDELVALVGAALAELSDIDRYLDDALAFILTGVVSASPSSSTLSPLSDEHRRLLRYKSYSYPFLTEDSWRRAGDAKPAEAAKVAMTNGDETRYGDLKWSDFAQLKQDEEVL